MPRADFYLIDKPRFREEPLLLVCELAKKACAANLPTLVTERLPFVKNVDTTYLTTRVVNTTNAKEQVALEKKDDIKKRLGFSPDDADSLAISFAMPVMKRPPQKGENSQGVIADFDPYA